MYATLSKRRARVLREEMREGSDLFSIHAYLPAQVSRHSLLAWRLDSASTLPQCKLLAHSSSSLQCGFGKVRQGIPFLVSSKIPCMTFLGHHLLPSVYA